MVAAVPAAAATVPPGAVIVALFALDL